MRIYLRLDAPYQWVRVDESKAGIADGESKIDAFGEVQGIEDYILADGDEVVGVVSGDWVTTHQVDLPAKTKKMFSAALPYALEESISEDVENMHFIIPAWKAGEACQVLAMAKHKMQEWADLAHQYKLPITRLVADHALIPMHSSAQCSIVVDGDKLYARKEGNYGVSLDSDFLSSWVMDVAVDLTVSVNDKELTEQLIAEYPNRDFRHWDCGNKLVHWLEYPESLKVDLWGDHYRPSIRRSGSNPYTLPLLLLALLLISKVGFDAYQTIALKSEIAAIKKEAQITFKKSLPDFGEVASGQEKNIMEQVLSRTGSVETSINLQQMLGVVARATRGQKITMTEFSFKNDELLITCALSDFSQVDQLAKKINSDANLTSSLQSSETDDGRVIATYLIKKKEG